MRSRHLIFSAIELLVVLFAISTGLVLIGIPYSPYLRNSLISVMMDSSFLFLAAGTVLLTTGLLLFVAFYLLNRKRYLSIEMGADIEESIIAAYLKGYWVQNFPEVKGDPEISLNRDNTLEIFANVPNIRDLKRIEMGIQSLLREKIGYQKPFTFTVVEGSQHREGIILSPPVAPQDLPL